MHPLTKKIFRFAIPSITSMWVFTLYTIIDGIFIGRYLGPLALGATNIAMPIFNLAFGFGIMIAVGASTLIAISFANKNREKGNYYFNLASISAFILGIFLSILCFLFIKPLISFLGADDVLFPFVYNYIQLILFFFPFYLCGYGWEIYIKVDGNAIYPMLCVILGAGINIVLDYYFLAILHTGIRGAALATGIAQMTTTLFLLLYITKKSKSFFFQIYRYSFSSLFSICKTGISEFFTEISTGILTLIFNSFVFLYLQNQGIISYSIINYISSLIIMTMIGFSQGVQPILSFSFGKKAKKEIFHIFKVSILCIGALNLFFTFITFFFSHPMVHYFINSSKVSKESVLALQKYSLTYLVLGFNILFSSFFTAMRKPGYASLITFLRAIIFPYFFLFILPHVIAVNNLWFCAFLSEVCTLFVSVYFYQKYIKEIAYDKIDCNRHGWNFIE